MSHSNEKKFIRHIKKNKEYDRNITMKIVKPIKKRQLVKTHFTLSLNYK